MTENTHSPLTDPKITTKHRYIAVEGPIGVGKTTLAKRLAQSFNYQILLEKADQNPFLDKFYRKERDAALATQLFFLFQRAGQLNELQQEELFEPVRVADFLMEKDRLFAKLTLDQNEYQLYDMVYQQLSPQAPTPDLVVYLQAPADVLMERIQKRGIDAERNIDKRYLEDLNSAYSEFFHFYDAAPLLIINATDIDFADNEQHYNQLLDYLLGIKNGRHYFNPTMLD
ncbi:MAG: deoxynucleoside kinase [Pseudomonadales bacterium]